MRNFTLEDLSRYNGKLLHCPAAAAAAATTRIQPRPRHALGARHTTARRLPSRTRVRSAGLNEIPEHHGRKSIYIAVSGVVFDMTSGGDFYGPGTLCIVLRFIPLMANTDCNLSRLSSHSAITSLCRWHRVLLLLQRLRLPIDSCRSTHNSQVGLTLCLLGETRRGAWRP
jgi:predicted heme/steroid binding protein